MSRVFYHGASIQDGFKGRVNRSKLTIKDSRRALTSGPNILDIIGSGIWGSETGPPEAVDFSGDGAGIGGGGISSEAFPALDRVVAAVLFVPLLAVFGGIASQRGRSREGSSHETHK